MTASSIGAAAQEAAIPGGTWTGVLDLGSIRLRLKLSIDADHKATLYSLDQGAHPIPGLIAALTPDRIDIDFPMIHGNFTGRMTTADRIEGRWKQRVTDLPLAFERGETAASEPPVPPKPLTDERLAELRKEAGSPALGAAAARGAAPPRIWVDGERSVGSGVAVTPDDIWHLGSITKSMTATLVAWLVEAGAVRWDDAVGDALKTVAPDMVEVYRSVTFRHLLCHRAGLPTDLPIQQILEFSREIADAREERKKWAQLALTMPPIGPKGSTYTYSNNGYIVVGAMLEAKLGKSWEDLIGTHLFEPLGLGSAGFGAPGHAGAIVEPVGHNVGAAGERRLAFPVGGGISDNPVALGPAGRVHMSLPDLLRYLAAHRDRGALLQPETWTTLHTPPFGGAYAMGWIVRDNGALWHNGSNTLWYAEVLIDTAAGTVAAAASNDGYVAKSQPEVGHALIEAAAAV